MWQSFRPGQQIPPAHILTLALSDISSHEFFTAHHKRPARNRSQALMHVGRQNQGCKYGRLWRSFHIPYAGVGASHPASLFIL